jgi:PHP domain
MRNISGIIHVHTKYSRDGEMDLEGLALAFRRDGHQFICLTEHAEDLGTEKMADLAERCRTLSDDDFCVIPGLEFDSAEGLHILGLGLSDYVRGRSAAEIIAAVHALGGLVILAHPKPGAELLLTGSLELPDGVELWNTKYDTRYAPRLHRFSVLRRLRALKPDVWGYCSPDFHWKNQYRKVSVRIWVDRIAQKPILNALKAGQFACAVGHQVLQPQGTLSGVQMVSFGLLEYYARLLLLTIQAGKRVAQILHLPLPKRRLRKIALRVT